MKQIQKLTKISSRIRSFAAFLIVIISLITGCSEKAPEKPNVLLIIVDTLRADHIGCYGGRKGVSPSLDKLASQGVQFMNAYSTAPWTQPAVASILTSLYPTEHGVVKLFDTLSSGNNTFAERLQRVGYLTGAIISHKFIGSKFGFSQGFDYFNERNARGHQAITSQEVTRDAIQWLANNKDRSFFLMLHYFDPHYVYQHHQEFNYIKGYQGSLKPGENIEALRDKRKLMTKADVRFLQDLYDEEISYTDKQIGVLMDYLAEAGLKEKTLIVFTADHGEEFMTHGWIGHTRTLYEELVHVPLIFSYPRWFRTSRVESQVSIIDILPTVLDLLGVPYDDADLSGISLGKNLNYIEASNKGHPIFFEVSFGNVDGREDLEAKGETAFKKAVLENQWKLIHDEITDQLEIYNIAEDPAETKNLIDSVPHIRTHLESYLKAWSHLLKNSKNRHEQQRTISPSDKELEELKALGYIQ